MLHADVKVRIPANLWIFVVDEIDKFRVEHSRVDQYICIYKYMVNRLSNVACLLLFFFIEP